LKRLQFNVQNLRCLDIGLSTGGFADCLLQAGAAHVVGVDVGHGQLAEKLKTEANLKQFEGVHVRDIPACAPIRAELSNGVDLVTVDVSFISLTHVIPVLKEILPHGAKVLALVKPQFEVGPANLDKNGIVQDPKLFTQVQADILRAFEKYGFSIAEYFASEVKGQDGNQEFFIFAAHN
jgi:23S rRNA (cytidine1920-2'-O)/16S rRNA (cytidine1409-2'-O)-methyltransferase